MQSATNLENNPGTPKDHGEKQGSYEYWLRSRLREDRKRFTQFVAQRNKNQRRL